ncbi:hypothetical protein [Marinivivus vitaminiproducens]|uniref:hypothetical protein n=1 Tax=Marinivivus vitaminiproducens TaxID=3035935 RepID=UPI002799D025|nr:hypothetical protein P4R82_03025 [Geminicoccaceae bacterium SCSIO 64248]
MAGRLRTYNRGHRLPAGHRSNRTLIVRLVVLLVLLTIASAITGLLVYEPTPPVERVRVTLPDDRFPR